MTVENIKKSFIDTFNEKGMLFFNNIEDEDSYVIITRKGNNLDEINIYVGFDLRNDGAIIVTLGFYELHNFTSNRDKGILACNKANCTVGSKFFIDDDDDAITISKMLFDAYTIKTGFSAEMVLLLAFEIAMDVDEVYPIFADAANLN